ncbi:MAG: hypothetical protein IJ333_04970 [Clostridia bacterium]|nr:hypothetical protein [Clostridia bacterium]
MFAWWNALSFVAQIFACVAIPATVVLLIQTILMLIGMGMEADGIDDIHLEDLHLGDSMPEADLQPGDGVFHDGVPEGDIDPSGLADLKIFSVRGLIAFFVVFGWVGFVMENAGAALWLTVPIATVCGFSVMFLLALLMRAVMHLRNDGNLDNRNALGVAGKVYLTIPPSRSGEGKVNVLLQGSYVEREAVTDETEAIPTGCEVVVTGLSGQTTLVVKRK